ncbi:protein FAR1-RELATED SEQUENCE 5-like [Silene latifolia]|uniref:protein FAR1-RELATED SEQUENCE 5-like n=1 Tax=Silene latifolia TaxID=37657 RepID=UPI003D76CD05
MTEVQKQFVTKVEVLKLGGVKAYRGWKELCGGYDNIGATKVDFKNFVRGIKTYIGNFDAQMFVENLIGRKDTCSSFYFDFIVDENKCLAGVFWADPICIKNYMLFGEVLSADATYGINKYDMVFVPFTGVDHHKRCITFGAGLIGDKSIECYTWLFKTFLEAMGGCQPRIIITDQDKSMKSVVPEVFKESTHRLCMWYIMKKLREKVSYQLFQDEDFKTRLNRCVWNNQLEPDEFEEQWGKIMTDYQLVEHEWFSDLYDLREQWIPAYFKDVSMSGLMRVTSRSESENSFFDRFLTPHLTLVEFWVCYESALEAQRHKHSKLNSDNKHSEIPRKTKSNLEVHASEILADAK